ncbi:uncharacterized protein LOC142341245 [Convolutriloba macropyga]|uniref:uncharacterized protein LOC142341245 n=1 Tax=Convolutriloba macropyga TaxID=536237 RepID=UPI003F525BBA
MHKFGFTVLTFLRYCLIVCSTESENRDYFYEKVGKTYRTLHYTRFSPGATFIVLLKIDNPLVPDYEYISSQFVNKTDEKKPKEPIKFENVPIGNYYEFREFVYDYRGTVSMIVIYKDYGLMDIPPVKFSSGQLSDSLTVQFDFSIWAITEYAWRLMELDGDVSRLVLEGGVERKDQKIQLRPLKYNTEYLLYYYAEERVATILLTFLRYCLNVCSTESENRDYFYEKVGKTYRTLHYTRFSPGATFIVLLKIDNPLVPDYEYISSQFVNKTDEKKPKEPIKFENVPIGNYYEFREFVYDYRGTVSMIVIYKDYGLMDIPPVKFSSGQLSDSLTVQFDFSIWAITEYAWRLMELDGDVSRLVLEGGVERKDQKIQLRPLKYNTEYLLYYYAEERVATIPNGKKLIVGWNAVSFHVEDRTPWITLTVLILAVIVAVALRIRMEVSAAKRLNHEHVLNFYSP